jgi:hypothetical protein
VGGHIGIRHTELLAGNDIAQPLEALLPAALLSPNYGRRCGLEQLHDRVEGPIRERQSPQGLDTNGETYASQPNNPFFRRIAYFCS